MVTRTVVAVAAVILLSASCGKESNVSGTAPASSAGSLESALNTVTRLVDATVAEVLPDAPTSAAPDNGDEQACTDSQGSASGEVQTQYGIYAPLPEGTDVAGLLQDVQAFWEAEGYEVNTDNAESDPPALFIDHEGYNFQFLVNDDGRAIVGGSTPCFEEGSDV